MSSTNYENRIDAAMICLIMNFTKCRKKFTEYTKILRYPIIKEFADYICQAGDGFDLKLMMDAFDKQVEPGDLMQIKFLDYSEDTYDSYFKRLYGDYLLGVLQDYNIKLLNKKQNDYMDIRTGLQQILNTEKYDDDAIHPDIKRSCVSFIEYIQKGHVRSYLEYFDTTQNGIPIDSFLILAALSSNGKTSYIINQMTKMILDGKRVCFFSLEMSEFAIIEQIVANLSGINTLDIKADMSQSTESKISDALDKLYTHNNLWIYDRPRTIEDIIDKAKYQRDKNKIEYIFVDYIQIIRSGVKNIVERLDHIATELQGLSRTLQIPVIALSQFNRSVGDATPDVTKLKGSGTLEQSADIVLLMYNHTNAIDGDFGKRLVNFYIGKNRKGMKDIEYQEIFKPATRQFLYQGVK